MTNQKISVLENDPHLHRIKRLCLRLPESTVAVHADYAEFRVRKKLFAYFLANHDKDGITSLCCRTANGENEERVRLEPTRFYLPPYIGKKGWFGLRLDRGRINWKEVATLLEHSYCLAAPATLVRRLQQP